MISNSTFFFILLYNMLVSWIMFSVACTASKHVWQILPIFLVFKWVEPHYVPPGFNGLNLRTTSCLNWKKWWTTLEPQHLNKEDLRIPTWSRFHLKIWRRESWRLWRDTMGGCPAKIAVFTNEPSTKCRLCSQECPELLFHTSSMCDDWPLNSADSQLHYLHIVLSLILH